MSGLWPAYDVAEVAEMAYLLIPPKQENNTIFWFRIYFATVAVLEVLGFGHNLCEKNQK